jgi:hypothetical protein
MASGPVEREKGLRPQTQPGEKLRGARLVLARLAWLVIAAFSGGLFVVSIPASYSQQASLNLVFLHERLDSMQADLQQLGLSAGDYGMYNIVIEVIFASVCIIVGSIVFARRSDDVMALLMSLFLVTLAASIPKTVDIHAMAYPEWAWTTRVLSVLSIGFFLLALYTFPDGRFLPRWTRWLALFCAAVMAAWFLLPGTIFDADAWPPLFSLLFLAAFLASPALVQVYRYRRYSDPFQKQQTKWVVFGSSIALAGFITVLLLSPVFTEHQLIADLITGTLQYLFLLFIPISIGIAILRNRLFDIDILINRTLVYIPLTGILTGLYAASIALFQRLFVAATGEKSDAAIVLTTLVLASTFTPIKNGLQVVADRRFKEVPDDTKRLRALGKEIESRIYAIDPYQVTRRLLDEAAAAFQAQSGAAWLAKDGPLISAHTHGEWKDGDAEITVPLEYNDERIGLLQLSRRDHERRYSKEDQEVLQQVAAIVARAVAGGQR